MDEAERRIRGTDLPNESYYMARALREIYVQEAEILGARKPALKDCNCRDDENVDEDVKIEDEESELKRERAQTKEDASQTLLPVGRYEI